MGSPGLDVGKCRILAAQLLRTGLRVVRVVCCLPLVLISGGASAGVVWSGDFETGNFLQWHQVGDTKTAFFAGIPDYGRPPAPNPLTGTKSASYYGDGSLAQLVTAPVRQGKYAARIVVKNSKNGAEPQDCDSGGTVCTRRRTELLMHRAMSDNYNGMPYMSERWVSASYYVPSDWDSTNGNGMLHVLQLKPRNDGSSIGPALSVQLENEGWKIRHKWSDKLNPAGSDVPWQQSMEYSAIEPTSKSWSGGLSDFPDEAASRNALGDFNKGGWTDWVFKIKFDSRGSAFGGGGYITAWKRAGSGPWVKVVHIKPKLTTRGGMTFDHGICFNSPPTSTNNGGFDVQAGMYIAKEQVWNLPANRVIYIDNVKVGDANAEFKDMSPDGSTPDSAAPLPPHKLGAT
jgi:hypothetical protein